MRHPIRALKQRFREDHAGRNGESGFVAVFIGLVLVVMLIFAAFTVDFGSWYTRSAEIKRAADAAALAGVVWMPEFDLADQAARAAATRNGFTNNVNNISVEVKEVPGNNRQLEVTIRDRKAKQFFSRLVTQSQSIGRSSLAEYVLPVPMGSPKNTFGTGDQLSGSDRENFWAAVSGYCSGQENGDELLSRYVSLNTSSSNGCGGGSAESADYDARGYLYAIDLPANRSTMKLDVFDGEFDTSSTRDQNFGGTPNIDTTYTIYNRNGTPLDESVLEIPAGQPGSLVAATRNVATNDSDYMDTWRNLYTWSNPQAGRYYVRVKTAVNLTNSRGSNAFGLRVYTTNSWSSSSVCSTITTATNYNANCAQIHAVSDMSIAANLPSTSGSTADFYLASIDPIHAGKTMRINLFDPGEGAQKLRIVDPNGAFTTFTWSTPCNPPPAPNGGCSGTALTDGSGPYLDVSGTGTQPYTSAYTDNFKYNGRLITIDIPLPSNYSSVYWDATTGVVKTWWKINYTVGSKSSDRTTWSVNIVGDPVHLLN